VAVVIFYFNAAPLMKTLMKIDPLSEARIRERRGFVLEFISAALFRRDEGGERMSVDARRSGVKMQGDFR
jgi:hypothetical protein